MTHRGNMVGIVSRIRRHLLLVQVTIGAIVGLLTTAFAGLRPGHPAQMIFGVTLGGVIAWTVIVEWFLVHIFDGMNETERHYRRREGRCLECGYRLRGIVSDVCPECGSSVSL